jgi:hypothetical protein
MNDADAAALVVQRCSVLLEFVCNHGSVECVNGEESSEACALD